MSHYIILVVIVRYIFRAGGEKCVFAVCFCLHFLYVIENKTHIPSFIGSDIAIEMNM